MQKVLDIIQDNDLDPKEFVVMGIKSPAQIQEKLKHNAEVWEQLAPYISAESSGTTLVRADDAREPAKQKKISL